MRDTVSNEDSGLRVSSLDMSVHTRVHTKLRLAFSLLVGRDKPKQDGEQCGRTC